MKYGEALPQRSVLEWLPFNLDYNDICDVIKKRTLGKPPVADPRIKSDFEDELFSIFIEQLDRIELFVKSKSGEIDRRIVHCSRLVTALHSKDNNISSKRVARYVKAENEIERAGQDIQNLSRFVNVQYTGFIKLLKKYRKWTGSSTLAERFLPILESPSSFHNRDFEKHVLQMSELLATVRTKFDESVRTSKIGPPMTTENISPLRAQAHALGMLLESENPSPTALRGHANLDTALGTNSNCSPTFTTGKGGKAVFWVHNDYLIEIQVLLLKYLNLKSPITPYPTAPPTPTLSRRPSFSSIPAGSPGYEKDENVSSVLLDNLSRFSRAQSASTIEEASETGPAAKVRWCGNSKDSEASIVVGPIIKPNGQNEDAQYTLQLKRKHVEMLIDPAASLTLKEQREEAEKIKIWFREHLDVVPLVKLVAKRTRFSSGEKVWALLDRDIRMYKLGEDWKGCISNPNWEERGTLATFPHAVLEIRWEGPQDPPFLKELTQSHLVEVVRGFSLDVHAVAVLHKPKEMSPPSWYHALSKDIRKTPINYPRKGSVSKPFAASAAPSSTSTVVGVGEQTDALDSSGTLVTFSNQSTENLPSTFSKKPKSWSRGKYSPHRTTENSWLGGERYWSEFNDEDEEDEPYTILVSPDPPSDYGQPHGVMAWMMEKLKNFFSFTEESHIGERQHLLPDMADSSDEDLEDGVTGRALNYGYSTFSAQNQDTQMRIRESILYRGYCLSFLASTAILSISGAWVVSGSSKKHASDLRTGLAEALCVFASVVLAGYAASLFVARKDNVSLLHKSTVYGLFCAICLGGSFMLSIVYNNCLRP